MNHLSYDLKLDSRIDIQIFIHGSVGRFKFRIFPKTQEYCSAML